MIVSDFIVFGEGLELLCEFMTDVFDMIEIVLFVFLFFDGDFW
jgi:hypothetical protein